MKVDFSVRRCCLLIRADLVNYRKEIAVCAAALILFFAVGFWLNKTTFENDQVPAFMYHFFLVVGGALLASVSLRDMDQNRSGLNYLTLPASQNEKIISRLSLTSVGYMLALTFMFIPVQVIALQFYELNAIKYSDLLINRQTLNFFILYVIFFYGSTRFRTMALFKTLVTGTIVYTLFYFVVRIMVNILFWDIIYFEDHMILLRIIFSDPIMEKMIWIPTGAHYLNPLVLLAAVFITMPFAFLPAAFLRFKESEI